MSGRNATYPLQSGAASKGPGNPSSHTGSVPAVAVCNEGDKVDVYMGGAALDWLTITGFEPALYEKWLGVARLVTGWNRGEEQVNRLQYRGQAGTQYFVGAGMQKGEEHFMAQFSGGTAENIRRFLDANPRHVSRETCSRMDIQVTIEDDPLFSIPSLGRFLMGNPPLAWRNRGNPPRVRYIANSDGLDTLYVGTRTSKEYTRLYRDVKAGRRVMRYEVELKGEKAQVAWQSVLRSGRQALDGILLSCIDKWPSEARPFLVLFEECLRGRATPLSTRSYDPNDLRTLRWLDTAVLPAIERVGEGMHRQALEEWALKVICIVNGMAYNDGDSSWSIAKLSQDSE